MCFVGAAAVGTQWRRVCAEMATRVAGSCGTGMFPSCVWLRAPAAGGRLGAFEGVVAELLAVAALGVGTKTQAALKAECRGKGR